MPVPPARPEPGSGPTRRGLLAAGGGALALTALTAAPARAAGGGLATDRPVGSLEVVHTFSRARCRPASPSRRPAGSSSTSRSGATTCRFTVAELRDGDAVAYPDLAVQHARAATTTPTAFVSVQSVVVDPADRLWILDTGSPLFQPTEPGGPKLVGVDLDTDRVVQTIVFPPDVALPTTYLNDVRFDLRRGEGRHGVHHRLLGHRPERDHRRRPRDRRGAGGACTTTRRTKAVPPRDFLPVVEGRPLHGARRRTAPPKPARAWAPTASRSPPTASASTTARSPAAACTACPPTRWSTGRSSDAEVAATVVDEGDKGGGVRRSGDRRPGARLRHDVRAQRDPAPPPGRRSYETLVHDPRLLWPDTMSRRRGRAPVLHRQPAAPPGRGTSGGKDLRREAVRRCSARPIDAGPVRLR